MTAKMASKICRARYPLLAVCCEVTPREKLIGFPGRIERRSQTHDKDQLCTPLTRFKSAVNPTFRPVHQIFLVNTYLFLEN